MNLSTISTLDLVSELKRREGVSTITAEPHEAFTVSTNESMHQEDGPAVILIVID